MNRYVVTNVGLNPADYKDIDDLQLHGLATGVGDDDVYEAVVAEMVDVEDVLNKFLADLAAGGNAVLPMSFTLTAPIIIEKDVTIDLNGYSLTAGVWDEDGDPNSYVFWVKSGTLTLNGEGAVIASDATYSMAVWANGGNVVINDGIYTNGGDSCDLIYVSKKGTITINGGDFRAAGPASGKEPGTKNSYSAINIKDKDRATCTVAVKGGRFLGFDPANNLSEGEGTNFVAEGFESVADGKYFVVREVDDIVVDDNE
jgi:hypothetical protein